MNKDIEKFNRALNKFLEDNPDLDFDTVKDEFIQMYNNGEYQIDDEYEQANDLYLESLNAESNDEAIAMLHKALEICPYYYEAKIDLLEMNSANIEEYLELLDEYRGYLDGKLDLDNIDGKMWFEIEHRPYLRLLMYIGVYFLENRNKVAIDYFQEVVRLDENMKLNQEIYLLSAYVVFDEAIKAINYFKALPKSLPGYYHLLYALALINNNNYDKAIKQILLAQKDNPNYIGLFTGTIVLNDEDVEKMEEEMLYEPKSLDEAYLNLLLIKDAIVVSENNINDFISDKYDEIVVEILPNPDEFKILLPMFSLEPQSLKNIISLLNGTKYKENEYCGFMKDYTSEELNRILKELLRKGFIKESDKKGKYEISYYGFCALKRVSEGMEEE